MKTSSYWNNEGRHQALYDELMKLVPASGECADAKTKNKALDRLRRAGNCYYDLFNNGLCNRASEFRAMFGFSPKKEYRSYGRHVDIDFDNAEMNQRLNAKLDELILAAAEEQGVDAPGASFIVRTTATARSAT